MERDYRKVYLEWLNDPLLSEGERAELLAIQDDDQEIQERFFSDIRFGTAGLRGLIRAGSNSINITNVRKASQAVAQYVIESNGTQRGVAIGYDSRIMSPEFAHETARVLCGNGITVYLFESLRPVPVLSFAVRHLECIAGIEITASHNPAEYNGYKVYDAYGGQLPLDASERIEHNMAAIGSLADVHLADPAEAAAQGLWNSIGTQVDDAYICTF